MTGTLVQLSISPGGMPKLPTPSARVTRAGVEGDWQTNRKYHGGPDRAICLFSEELYDWLRAQGVASMVNGSVGENFTTRGIDLLALSVGNRLRVGPQCVIQMSDVREPCRQLKKWDERFPKLIVGRSGWMAKVVEEGTVNTGDRVCFLTTGNREVIIEAKTGGRCRARSRPCQVGRHRYTYGFH